MSLTTHEEEKVRKVGEKAMEMAVMDKNHFPLSFHSIFNVHSIDCEPKHYNEDCIQDGLLPPLNLNHPRMAIHVLLSLTTIFHGFSTKQDISYIKCPQLLLLQRRKLNVIKSIK